MADHVVYSGIRRAGWIWAGTATVYLAYAVVAGPQFNRYPSYWDISTGILQTHSLAEPDGTPTAEFEPGYPAFLAAIRATVGDRPRTVQIVQAIAAAFGAVALDALAIGLTGRPGVGAIAALLFATYPLLIRHAGDPTESGLLTLALVAFAATFARIKHTASAVGCGCCFAAAALIRSIVLPVGVVACVLATRRSRTYGVAFGLTSIVLLAPYHAWLDARTGSLTSTRAGVNLFVANCRYAPAVMPAFAPDVLMAYSEQRLAAFLPGDPAGRTQEGVRNAAFARMAVDEIRKYPWRIARLKLVNIFEFFSPWLVPYRETTPDTVFTLDAAGNPTVRGGAPRPLALRAVYTGTFTPLALLAAIGAWHRRRELFGSDAVLWAIVIVYSAVYALFFPTTRYRAPIDFVLLFYAAVAADRWLQRRSRVAKTASTATAA